MFGSRFGHLRFSLGSDSVREFSINSNFRDSLKGLVGFGLLVPIVETYFDGVSGTATLTPTIPMEFNAQDFLNSNVDIIGGVVVTFSGDSSLNGTSSLIKNIGVVEPLTDSLVCKPYVGKDIHFSESFSTLFKNTTNVVKNLVVAHTLTDILNSNVSTVVLENIVFKANVTIPPGGTLEIRSDTYDLFLNGENILHLQEGDWVFLDRDVVTLQVDSGTSGELEGRILYNERYL